MNYRIVPTVNFDKKVKILAKKYRSLKADLDAFEKELTNEKCKQIFEQTKNLQQWIKDTILSK